MWFAVAVFLPSSPRLARSTAASLAVALVTLGLCAAASGTAGLLRNPDFEQRVRVGETRVPAGWSGEPETSSMSLRGARGARHLAHRGREGSASAPWTQNFDCAPNTEYVLTAITRSEEGTRPLIRIVVPGLDSLQAVKLVPPVSEEWRLDSVRFNSGEARRLRVELFGDESVAEGSSAGRGASAIDRVQVFAAADLPPGLRPPGWIDPPGPNIALGRSCTWDRSPNYPLSRDAEDRSQITDGVYTVGYFWTQRSTVGWLNKQPVELTIELKRVEPIAGVSFSTAAGVAGVSWPSAIDLFVSDDGESWHHAGDLIALGLRRTAPPTDRYLSFRFSTDALRTRGRYVRFVIDGSPYVFVDEIEVYRGEPSWLDRAPGGPAVEDPGEQSGASRVHNGRLWRLRLDLEAARASIESAGLGRGARRSLERWADALLREIEALPETVPADFRTVLPFSELHARIYALHAPVLRAAGHPPLSVWIGDRWEPLTRTTAPPAPRRMAAPAIDVRMMRLETRSAAFRLTNATDVAMPLALRVTGLPGGPNPDYLVVREVAFTDTREREPVATALPLAERTATGYRVVVPAGCTGQVWLDFQRPTLDPGEYAGRLLIEGPEVAGRHAIPIRLRIAPFDFPDQPGVAVGGWDYTNNGGAYEATPENIPRLIELLRDSFVDVPWANWRVRPRGGLYDEEGRLTSELDFTDWDAWVALWPGARIYAVYLAAGDRFEGEPLGTERFGKMVGSWIRAWTGHMRKQGVDPRRVALLLVDEPRQAEQVKTILGWARAIEAAAPELLIWENPTPVDPLEVDPELYPWIDVVSPNLSRFAQGSAEDREFYLGLRDAGKPLWFYSCTRPTKLLDPYVYHRGQFWWAIRYGASGSSFWAFASDGGGSTSWNAYSQTRSHASPLFLTPTDVTTSKHMAAIREGVEDFEYFRMLERRVAHLRSTGVPHPALDAAAALIREGPERVVRQLDAATARWRQDLDRSLIDRTRLEVLDHLLALR